MFDKTELRRTLPPCIAALKRPYGKLPTRIIEKMEAVAASLYGPPLYETSRTRPFDRGEYQQEAGYYPMTRIPFSLSFAFKRAASEAGYFLDILDEDDEYVAKIAGKLCVNSATSRTRPTQPRHGPKPPGCRWLRFNQAGRP